MHVDDVKMRMSWRRRVRDLQADTHIIVVVVHKQKVNIVCIKIALLLGINRTQSGSSIHTVGSKLSEMIHNIFSTNTQSYSVPNMTSFHLLDSILNLSCVCLPCVLYCFVLAPILEFGCVRGDRSIR